MFLQELLGRSITQIHAHEGLINGWIATVQHYLRLDNGELIHLPYPFESDTGYVPLADPVPAGADSLRGIPFLLHQPIVDVICYNDDDDPVLSTCLLELANGYVLGAIHVAPFGTGDAALWYFASIAAAEARFGRDYRRLAPLNRPD